MKPIQKFKSDDGNVTIPILIYDEMGEKIENYEKNFVRVVIPSTWGMCSRTQFSDHYFYSKSDVVSKFKAIIDELSKQLVGKDEEYNDMLKSYRGRLKEVTQLTTREFRKWRKENKANYY